MKRFFKILMVAVPAALISLGFYYKSNDTGEDVLLKVIVENLKHLHYTPIEIDDQMSEKAFNHYLDYIDGNKRFLIQEDVDKLAEDKYLIDDQTRNGQYFFFDKSIDILTKRAEQCRSFYKEILAKPFDFTIDETANFGEDIPYAANEEELKERWRQYLKYSVMTRLSNALDIEESKSNDTTNTDSIKAFTELEAEARKGVLENHDRWFERLEKLRRKDRLSTYVNSITTLYDPHTTYFPPADKANFDIRMSGQLEGIGAQLQEKDGYIKVNSIVPGAPAYMQGQLKANDVILKVAQGDEEPVDIVNVAIDDAVKLIRGKKGTEVRLTVKKPDGTVVIIPIIRDVVQLEETYAKSTLIQDETGTKVGYLYLPSFYADFNGTGGRSCSKDVEKELEKLNEAGAQSLIFDLRNNGGGSLQDVKEIVGLFIEKGPVVQVKSRNYPPRILADTKKDMLWDKPVIVMVNEFSASASEIFAAAIQDYGRGVIVGSHTTHGKGSVQQFVELNKTLRGTNYPDLGALKLTTQKFYRINGGATQLKGVTPDIIWPDNYMYIKTGEKEQENSLQWDKIEPAEYETMASFTANLKALKKASMKRQSASEIFQAIEENAKRWKSQRDKDVFTLNLDAHRAEAKENSEFSESYKSLFKPIEDLSIQSLVMDLEEIQGDTIKEKRVSDWHASLKKDVYLYETLQIAEEMTSIN